MKIQRFQSELPAVRSRIAILALLASIASMPAMAIERGSTPAGVRYVSGGIGVSELKQLHAERGQYRLWVATVARGTGAYLANAHVRITPATGGKEVLDLFMDGPWLFVDLPVGQYEVWVSVKHEASGLPLVQQEQVRIDAKGLRQVVLRFATPVDVAPEQPKLFDGNPFGGDTPH